MTNMTENYLARLIPAWLWAYRGCFIPPLSVLAAFIVLALLTILLGDQHIPRLTFTSVEGFPDKMDIKNTFAIGKVALWWLFSVYLFWLIALIGSVTALFIANATLKDVPATARRIGFWTVAGILGLMIGVLIYLTCQGTPTYTGQDLFQSLVKLASGVGSLLQLTNGFAIIVIVLIILSAGIILMPVANHTIYLQRMKSLNLLLLIGAIVTLVWVFYARILYGFAASTYIASEQTHVAAAAPTISLVTGGVATIYLVIMYMSAFLWLQSRYATATSDVPVKKTQDKEAPETPQSLLFTLWPRVFMLTSPMLPGVFEIFFNFFDKV